MQGTKEKTVKVGIQAMAKGKAAALGTRVRSALFYAFSLVAILPFLLFLPTLLLPAKYPMAVCNAYLHLQLWLLKVVCGVKYEIEGLENLPNTGCLIASQHESSWETLYFQVFLGQPVMFAKREVFRYPLIGLLARKFGHIPVDRQGSVDAMREGFRAGRDVALSGRKILMFPTGTRTDRKEAPIQSGIGVLYQLVNQPTVPVLLNSGKCWPSDSFLKFPGTITVKILPPIQAGLDRRLFLTQLGDDLSKTA